jgi:hypothetical protein
MATNPPMSAIHLHCSAAVFFSLALCAFAKAADASAPIAHGADATSGDASSARWTDIKEHAHDRRTEFFAGLKRLEARLQGQTAELVAKRATMNGATDTREWDFAMKELEAAQSYFIAVGAEITKASRETWDQEKDKVGRAWVSTQDAYAKVKRSTTS